MNHYKHLTTKERTLIVHFLELGWSITKIATHLGRNKSTISRELNRNRDNEDTTYNASIAEERYSNRRKACKPRRKSYNSRLVSYIDEQLQLHWSPEQIAGRIALDYEEDLSMRVSFATIYRWLYEKVISKGDLSKLRRKGKSRNGTETRGKFNIGKTIKKRPKEVRKRKSVGHWELDTVVSGRGKSKACVATIVERKTRFAIAVLMPDRTSKSFNEALYKAMQHVPSSMVKSFTVDRGKEFAGYSDIEEELKTDVYFADPYAPWQRGTNENFNGLLREFFPKGCNFSDYTQADVSLVCQLINDRPKKCLGYRTPTEAMDKEI